MDRAIEKIEKGLSKLSDKVPKYTNNDMILAVGVTVLIVTAIPMVDQWFASLNRRLEQLKILERQELLDDIDQLIENRLEDLINQLRPGN